MSAPSSAAFRATIQSAQRLLQREFPSLKADGVWGRETDKAFEAASAKLHRDVIILVSGPGYSLNEIRDNVAISGTPSIQKKNIAVVRPAAARVSSAERAFIDLAQKAGVTGVSLANLMAQIKAESGFAPRNEDHHYSPERAMGMFKAAAKMTREQVRVLVSQGASAFFEAMYGYMTDIGKKLGNRLPGDGGKFLGRGLLQITGRDNYAALQAATGMPVLSDPDLLSRDFVASANAAIWYWKTKVMSRGADTSVAAATRIVAPNAHNEAARAQYAQAYLA